MFDQADSMKVFFINKASVRGYCARKKKYVNQIT